MTQRQDAVKLPEGFVERTPAGVALTEFVLQVVRLSQLFSAKGEALAKPSGQTLARWVALNAAAEAPASVAEISRRFGFARPERSARGRPAGRGRACRLPGQPAPRRAKLLVPTVAGWPSSSRSTHRQQAWADALGSRIGEAELEGASATIDRITRALR
jgi:hypothetical protein